MGAGYVSGIGHALPLNLRGPASAAAAPAATCDPSPVATVTAAGTAAPPAARVPLILVGGVPGSDVQCFAAAIAACYRTYAQWGGVAAEVAQDLPLDGLVDAGALRVGIRTDPSGETGTGTLPDGSAAIKISAKTDGSYPDGADRTFCIVLLHELLHARDIITDDIPAGSVPLQVIRYADNTYTGPTQTILLPCEELTVLINENRARELAGLTPRSSYPDRFERTGLVLPGALFPDGSPVYPTDVFDFDAVNPPQDRFFVGPCGVV
jgi:hypothetical protein